MKTLKKQAYLFLALCISLFFACGEPGEDPGEKIKREILEEVANDTLESEQESHKSVILLISHRVRDFNIWKNGFVEHDTVRESLSMDIMKIFRSSEDTNTITVILSVSDIAAAKRYASSSELKKSMEEFGVISRPNVRFLNANRQMEKSELITCLLVNHKVEDYNKWKNGFDKYETERTEHGLEVLNVFCSDEDVNDVTVLFGVNDMKSAQKYASSIVLKERMKEFGVINYAEISFLFPVQ